MSGCVTLRPSCGDNVYDSRPNTAALVMYPERVPRWSANRPVASNWSAVGSGAAPPTVALLGLGMLRSEDLQETTAVSNAAAPRNLRIECEFRLSPKRE